MFPSIVYCDVDQSFSNLSVLEKDSTGHEGSYIYRRFCVYVVAAERSVAMFCTPNGPEATDKWGKKIHDIHSFYVPSCKRLLLLKILF